MRETNNPLATRARFKDSVDFIGWYIHKTNKILKISKKDPYRQYLAYYKGWGDYKNYSKDKKAIIYAKSVKDMASKYSCLLYTSPSPRDTILSRMPSSA